MIIIQFEKSGPDQRFHWSFEKFVYAYIYLHLFLVFFYAMRSTLSKH